MTRPQVVITGAGLVTALGRTLSETWEAVRRGRCGIRPLTTLESPSSGAEGGEVPDPALDTDQREVFWLRTALDEAVAAAGLDEGAPYAPSRCGVVLGTTLAGMRNAGAYLRSGAPTGLRDVLAGRTLQRACNPAAAFTATTSAACASGLASIGIALTLLRSGRLDLVIAGGYDPISEYAYAGFNSLRLIADGPPRPFAADRQGMKLGEGYAVVVLERAADARRRGAAVLAAVAGYGETSDAYHLTKPHPRGAGAARALRAALRDAGLTASATGLIAAHATGTPDNDAAEHAALSAVFGDALPRIPLVAFKSHLGHTLGGAGAVELVLATAALRDGCVPPTANLRRTDLAFAVGLVPGCEEAEARPMTADHAVTLSLGFGGANSCVVLCPAPAPGAGPEAPPKTGDVLITGVGVVAAGIEDNAAFARRLRENAGPAAAQRIDDSRLDALLEARRVRRMSRFAKLLLAATRTALRDAGVEDVARFAAPCAAVLGSTHGAAEYSETYYREIVRDGMAAANPLLFAEGVPNVASAQLSLMLGLQGPAQTIVGTRTAGLDALQVAALRIACGEWRRAIIGAAEEHTPLIDLAYQACGKCARERPGMPFIDERGFRTADAAAVLILESPESAAGRSAAARGRVVRTAAAHLLPDGHAGPDLLSEIGDPGDVACSASATPLDSVESAMLTRSAQRAFCARRPLRVTTLAGRLGETFSVAPLASIAAGLLCRRLPALSPAPDAWPRSLRPAGTDGEIEDFGVLCSDETGPLRAARIALAVP